MISEECQIGCRLSTSVHLTLVELLLQCQNLDVDLRPSFGRNDHSENTGHLYLHASLSWHVI